jgi:hypothetical protein
MITVRNGQQASRFINGENVCIGINYFDIHYYDLTLEM